MTNARTLVESFMTALAERRFDRAAELLSDDFVFAGPVPQPIPKPAFLAVERAIHEAMDGWSYGLRILEEDGSRVRTTVRITATHARTLSLPLPGTAPQPARGAAIALPEEPTDFTIEGGKIARIDVAAVPGGGIPGLLSQIATGA